MDRRTALVTGANRGLGRAVADALAALGHRVVVTARDPGEAGATARELPGEAVGLGLDVTDDAAVAGLAERAGPIDILINNAGVQLDWGRDPLTVPIDTVRRQLEVNTLGAWRVTAALLPAMTERGWGRVVMVSSGIGTFANGLFPGSPGYSLSKAALNAATVLFARATSKTGVLVNAVNPGLVRTRMRPEAQRSPEAAAQDVLAAVLLPDDGPTGVLLRSGRTVPW
ncbi:SDR family NAD(P)-dependent oxidoreductase [Paractinoplanes ferrugineus]|uniref:Short-chain dehydrogenase n=1 Tax=Paractinoplanes ferrugineus TaxID=113564 RepID=A0A919J2R2_9ACTN|nr:SDR family NAD(P)-dependent oxidoreductase [Actinoplanes ferrugineus]GIE13706.1 short-chain dehydrogenase [Actinoplanes ferrugineus]